MTTTSERLRRWLTLEPGQATPEDHSLLLELARGVMIEKYTLEQGKIKVTQFLDHLREENQSPLEAYFLLSVASDIMSADLLRNHAERELAKQNPATDGPAGIGHYFEEGPDGSLYVPSAASRTVRADSVTGAMVSVERLATTLGIPADSIYMLLHSRRSEITEAEAGFVIDFHRKLTAEAEAAQIRINTRSELERVNDAAGQGTGIRVSYSEIAAQAAEIFRNEFGKLNIFSREELEQRGRELAECISEGYDGSVTQETAEGLLANIRSKCAVLVQGLLTEQNPNNFGNESAEECSHGIMQPGPALIEKSDEVTATNVTPGPLEKAPEISNIPFWRPLSGRPLRVVSIVGIAVLVVPTFFLWFIGIIVNIQRGNYAAAILWIAPLAATPWIRKRASRSVSGPGITTEAAAGTSSAPPDAGDRASYPLAEEMALTSGRVGASPKPVGEPDLVRPQKQSPSEEMRDHEVPVEDADDEDQEAFKRHWHVR
jgi:hypothetical protein